MARFVDLNRGVTKRLHPSGFAVCMYKDQPGVYLDASGREVSDEIARSAGFDIDLLARAKAKADKMAEARAKIEAEFAEKEKLIEDEINADAKRYEVRHVAFGKYAIFEGDEAVTKKSLTKDEAQALLKQMEAGSKPTDTEDPDDGKTA